jgi:hypothetical protein
MFAAKPALTGKPKKPLNYFEGRCPTPTMQMAVRVKWPGGPKATLKQDTWNV